MIHRNELSLYLHALLACDDFNDYAPNGLQIEGKDQIKRIATAVTASLDVIRDAIDWQADALFVHHGYFWRGEDAVLTGMKRERIAKLFSNNLNLFAYHLPLDCHPSLGNNASIAQRLSLESVKMHTVGNIKDLLWSGTLTQALDSGQLIVLLQNIFQREPMHIQGHHRLNRLIAWCSGGAEDCIVDAKRLNADAFISGEVSERTYYQAKELAIDYYACGHHATERFGIQALGEHLAKQFGLECAFFDSNNPF